MSVLESMLLGVLQGVTEFLPVSSSGHLVAARMLMGIGEIPVLYDVLLHLATLAVVIGVFRKRLVGVLLALLRRLRSKHTVADEENLRLAFLVLLATLTTAIVGLGISRLPDETRENPRLVAVLFVVTGLILLASRWFRGDRGYREIRAAAGVVTGLAQGLGVLPGISRSGITICTSLGVGLSRDRAAEYSFVMSIPAILGAAALKLPDAAELGARISPPALIAGLAASLIVGLGSLLLLIRLVRGGRIYLFSIYLIPLGIVMLFVL